MQTSINMSDISKIENYNHKISEKKWHKESFSRLKKEFNDSIWLLIDKKSDLNISLLNDFKPSKIFIPHWSYIINKDIYGAFECIVFHMTDLPFGRGGSPLQNLIVRGFKATMISAIKVQSGIDTGDIYLKKHLDLTGTAEEIFQRSSIVIEEMIKEIIVSDINPTPQTGEVVEFKRRKPEESNINNLTELENIYDHIRMLDCDGYPHAYVEISGVKYEFTDAIFDANNKIISADVRIVKK